MYEEIEALYRKYASGMLRYASKITGNPDMGNDALHEAFSRLLSKKETLKKLHPRQKEAYLQVTVRHAAYWVMKKWDALYPLELVNEIADEQAEKEIVRIAQRDEMQRALSTLPEIYRDVLFLHYDLDLPFSEVAQTLKIETAHAQVIASRARAKLRVYFADKGNHDGR